MTESPHTLPPEYPIILDWIETGSQVLDLGCGDGRLLELLAEKKDARCQGIEIDEKMIYQCVARGLSVIHGDLDSGLTDYAEKSFDYVVLNQSIQQVKKIDRVLKESLRIGRYVIVGFPNFGHYSLRLQYLFKGTAPVSPTLPYAWYDTPNIHVLSVKDFTAYCREKGYKIHRRYFLGACGPVWFRPNLLSTVALFMISQ